MAVFLNVFIVLLYSLCDDNRVDASKRVYQCSPSPYVVPTSDQRAVTLHLNKSGLYTLFCYYNRGGSTRCPGCPDTRPLIRCPFLKRKYFQNGRRFVGFWASGGAKFPKMGTIAQNLTPLALSPAEKSVTVQSDKFTNKQTNSNRHIHTAYQHVWK